jgi:uncharacterized OB-fold protein
LPFYDRFEMVEEAKSWRDHLPLRYKYSLGLAGEKFSKGLLEGKLLCSVCSNCNNKCLPPSIYCHECFREVSDYAEIEPTGEIYSVTEKGDELIVVIKFRGVQGSLIHWLKTPTAGKVRIGQKVTAVFKPLNQRVGDITDIDHFELSS